jgi:acyl-CoA synthetase (AMP-forming)/AMP-acid ligase II
VHRSRYVELLFACWDAGLCAVPINARLYPRELEFVLQNSGARLCFATAGLFGAVAPLQVILCIRHKIGVQDDGETGRGKAYSGLHRTSDIRQSANRATRRSR